jgi:rubrerythrin
MQKVVNLITLRRINMPDFGSPFSGLANDRKLTNEELIREIRFMVAAEYEATQLYMQLAESTDNKLAVEVLKEIADEELVHVGEFLRLLYELAPNEEKFYAKGAKGVEGKIKKKK